MLGAPGKAGLDIEAFEVKEGETLDDVCAALEIEVVRGAKDFEIVGGVAFAGGVGLF